MKLNHTRNSNIYIKIEVILDRIALAKFIVTAEHLHLIRRHNICHEMHYPQ